MSSFKAEKDYSELKRKVLYAAAKLFMVKGYSNSTTREIAAAAEVNVSTMNRCFGSKENILAELVQYVLESQFTAARRLLSGITDDNILFYAAETTLQLYMAESNENIRDLYLASYSLPNTSAIIMKMVTGKLEILFREHLPGLKTADFYKREIASGSIMRGFIAIPSDMWFTMEQKVEAFLNATLRVYDVPKEKIEEATAFVSQFDFNDFAKEAINTMLVHLEHSEQERVSK